MLTDTEKTRLQDLRAACEATAAGFRARLPYLAAPLDALADRARDELAEDAAERRRENPRAYELKAGER